YTQPSVPYDAIFTVSLSEPVDRPVIVSYATSDGTAKAGSDYQAVPTTRLTIDPGVTQVPVPVVVNPFVAGPATFNVHLFDPTDATIASGQVTATIAPAASGFQPMGASPYANFSISDVLVTAATDGNTDATFIVTLLSPVDSPVGVNYAT